MTISSICVARGECSKHLSTVYNVRVYCVSVHSVTLPCTINLIIFFSQFVCLLLLEFLSVLRGKRFIVLASNFEETLHQKNMHERENSGENWQQQISRDFVCALRPDHHKLQSDNGISRTKRVLSLLTAVPLISTVGPQLKTYLFGHWWTPPRSAVVAFLQFYRHEGVSSHMYMWKFLNDC